MRMQRVSVALSKCEVEEHVDRDIVRLWLLPHHGFYPTEAIARAVAEGHQCDTSGIKLYTWIVDYEVKDPKPVDAADGRFPWQTKEGT